MIQQIKSVIKDERGQGMTEYILIVVLIAIAAIVAFQYFRGKLTERTNSAADKVFSAD